MPAAKIKSLPVEAVIKKLSQLKSARGNFESIWQDIAEYIQPTKDDITTVSSPGSKKYGAVLDSTAMICAELLAGALHGMLTNPSGVFFGLSTGNRRLDINDAVRDWIQDSTRRMHDQLNQSNFQTEVHELYLDYVTFATSVMSIEEDMDDDSVVIRFGTRPLREVFIEENSKGVVDCVYRCYELDARGIIDEFGKEGLPQKILAAYDKGTADKFEVLHAIYPKRKATGKDSTKYTYVSQYILVKEKINLSVGGFYEFPWVAPRWSKRAGEVYGRGPGERALPEAKTVNKMTEVTLRGAQKVVDPPLQAPDDGFIMQLITKPGGINYYRAGSTDRIETIFNDARIDFGYQAIDMKQKQIREAFYVDQLKLREGPQMTATEVQERTEQALRFLGPMLGRMQKEFLQPLIERLFNIMMRRGLLAEVPAELDGVELKVTYVSVTAMAQRLSELQNIQRTMQQMTPFAAIDPACMDNFDTDAAARYISQLCNLPQELIRNKEALETLREKRAKAQQAQMQAEQASMEADQMGKVAGAAAKLQPRKAS